jgi:hypothetical protein
MSKLPTILLATITALGLLWASAHNAHAADATCTGSLGAQRFENLEVPAGATCTLNGTRVDGNIKVYNNATLLASNVTVGGNIQADGAANVVVSTNSTVDGSVQVKQGGGATVNQVRVNGDIQLESNRAALAVAFNRVGGNVQVFQNSGGATINDNVIDGNLQCKENNPAPTGARNQAASFEDQCAGFAGSPTTPTPGATPTSTPTPIAVPGGNGVCNGIIGAQHFENLDVPAGASCTLNGTIVDGNIKVFDNATLLAVEVTVGGNIQADGAAVVTVNTNSTVGGSVQVKQGGGATVNQVRVSGDIQLESNRGALVATFNQVGGNIQIFSNSALATISDNVIDGDLQCKQNNPPPVGGRNQAASYEDQCAGFAGEPTMPPAPTPGSNGVECRTTIGAQQVVNLIVPSNASCILQGTQVVGDVTVGAGATLQASSLAVSGDIVAQGAAVVTVNNNSTVGGKILLRQGGSATVDLVQVSGDLQVESYQSALSVTRNRVGGSVRAVDNRAGFIVRNNSVDGVLQCSGNLLVPISDANQAASLEDQCAALSLKLYLPAVAR